MLLFGVTCSLSTGSPVGCPNLIYCLREQADKLFIAIRVQAYKGNALPFCSTFQRIFQEDSLMYSQAMLNFFIL